MPDHVRRSVSPPPITAAAFVPPRPGNPGAGIQKVLLRTRLNLLRPRLILRRIRRITQLAQHPRCIAIRAIKLQRRRPASQHRHSAPATKSPHTATPSSYSRTAALAQTLYPRTQQHGIRACSRSGIPSTPYAGGHFTPVNQNDEYPESRSHIRSTGTRPHPAGPVCPPSATLAKHIFNHRPLTSAVFISPTPPRMAHSNPHHHCMPRVARCTRPSPRCGSAADPSSRTSPHTSPE